MTQPIIFFIPIFSTMKIAISSFVRSSNFILTSLVALAVCGCASVNDIPQNNKSISFDSPSYGKTGSGYFESYYEVRGATIDQVFEAAKAAAGKKVAKASLEDGVVIVKHGISAYDWNAYSGIYIKGAKGFVALAIHTQESKEYQVLAKGPQGYNSYSAKLLKEIFNNLKKLSSDAKIKQN